MDELMQCLPHKKVIYDFSNTCVAFPPETLQQQCKQAHRCFHMQIQHTIWKWSLEKRQASHANELKIISQIIIRKEIIDKFSKGHRV